MIKPHFTQEEFLTSKINNILTPEFFSLSEIGVTEFGYRKFLNSGTTFGLCTKYEWNNFLQNNPTISKEMNSYYLKELRELFANNKRYFLRIGEYKNIGSDYLKILYKHGLWNSIACYHRVAGGVEGFYFIASCEQTNALENYFNHLEKLESFIKHIRFKINDIMNDDKYKFLHSKIVNSDLLGLLNSSFSTENKSTIKVSNLINQNNKKHLLSKRELEVAFLLINGLSYKEIGKTLTLSDKTVASYVATTKNKTGVHCRSQIVDFVNQNYFKKITIN